MADQDPNAGTSGSSAATRFAHDLRAIREERGVSLDDVQQDTRMPADILGRFESGELIGDQHYNEVYLRNLLKSYAQALGISAQEVLSAYDQAKAGAYDGALRRRFLAGEAKPEAEQKPASQPSPDAPNESANKDESADDESSPKRPRTSASGDKAPAVAALSSPRKEKEPRAEQTEPSRSSPTRPKRRVASASAASKPIEKSWGLITASVVGALVVIALILWFLFRDPGPEPELAEVPAPADTTAEAAPSDTAEATPEPVETSAAPQFQTPIRLSVVANEEPLENFRVRVDDDVRRPYWLNPGVDTTFVGQEEVVVWGELGLDETGGGDYDGATLRLQGLEWTPTDGRIVRINQQTGQALLDSLNRVSNAAPTG